MMRYVWIRILRKPMDAVAVLLFTAIIVLALCGLHNGNVAAQMQYEEIYDKIDVRCTVTNLAGDQSDRLNIPVSIVSLFTGSLDSVPADFEDLVEDVQIKGSTDITWNGETYTLTGITSVGADAKLRPENGCTIFWNDGVDESAFSGGAIVCIVPQKMAETLQEGSFPLHIDAAHERGTEYDGALAIVGTYAGKNDNIIYCPWETYVAILRSTGHYETADSLYATLRNNQDIALLRQTAAQYFAEPDPNTAGVTIVGDYFLALDINDSALEQAKNNMDNSMRLNRLAAIVVFALSAGAGFLIGFLVIRSRKREIALMRTLGASNGAVYLELAVEQLVCIILGIAVGGGYSLWQPIGQLCLFCGIYFIGLTAALLVFLHKNLLTTIKEDE